MPSNRSLHTHAVGVGEFSRYALRMRLAAAIAIISCAVAPGAVVARDWKSTPEFTQCMESTGGADPSMFDCYSAEFKRQDKRLNEAYKALLGKLDPERKKKLVEVQRQWLRFTDSNCDFYYDPNYGTGARLSAYDCTVRARSERATELEELAQ